MQTKTTMMSDTTLELHQKYHAGTSVVMYTRNPSPWKTKAGGAQGTRVQSHHMHGEFQHSQDYTESPCLKTQKQKKRKGKRKEKEEEEEEEVGVALDWHAVPGGNGTCSSLHRRQRVRRW